jgi:hypothetical protein
MMKIQKIISLDKETAELAAKKSNFSGWVRNQLRSERNKSENDDALKANTARRMEQTIDMSTAELLYHLENRTADEIRALVSLLRKV